MYCFLVITAKFTAFGHATAFDHQSSIQNNGYYINLRGYTNYGLNIESYLYMSLDVSIHIITNDPITIFIEAECLFES